MDGLAATREIRRLEAETGEHVIVIAMTANAGEEVRQSRLDVGMDDYLSKPVKLEALCEPLEKYLREPPAAA